MKAILFSLVILGAYGAQAGQKLETLKCFSGGFANSEASITFLNGEAIMAKVSYSAAQETKGFVCNEKYLPESESESNVIAVCLDLDRTGQEASNTSISLETGPMGEGGPIAFVRSGKNIIERLENCQFE
jgi:hypothetical protein